MSKTGRPGTGPGGRRVRRGAGKAEGLVRVSDDSTVPTRSDH